MEQLVAGAIRNEAEIVARLERCARLDPRLLRAIGGYELEPPIFDLTWTFRREPLEPDPPPERDIRERPEGGR